MDDKSCNAADNKGGGPSVDSEEIGDCAVFLDRIRRHQNDTRAPYTQALAEISGGQKRGHWIWYVWPSLLAIRHTRKPELQFSRLDEVLAYARDVTLRHRLMEVTQAATTQLRNGVSKETLMGAMHRYDVPKVHETVTCFLVVGEHLKDAALVECMNACVEALHMGGEHAGVQRWMQRWIDEEDDNVDDDDEGGTGKLYDDEEGDGKNDGGSRKGGCGKDGAGNKGSSAPATILDKWLCGN
jgi:uncharacterized protein (DUF1810 family)